MSFFGSNPFVVDLDKNVRDEAFQRFYVRKDADLAGVSLEFFLDATLNGIGGAQSAAMMVCLREHSQSVRHIVFEPFDEIMGLFTIALEQKSQIFFC